MIFKIRKIIYFLFFLFAASCASQQHTYVLEGFPLETHYKNGYSIGIEESFNNEIGFVRVYLKNIFGIKFADERQKIADDIALEKMKKYCLDDYKRFVELE